MRAIILLLLIAFPFMAKAEPALDNCNVISRVCLDANSTRIIDGFPIHAACWEWEDIHECDRNQNFDQCAGFYGHNECSKISENDSNREYGLTHTFYEQWRCPRVLHSNAPSTAAIVNEPWASDALSLGATKSYVRDRLSFVSDVWDNDCSTQYDHCSLEEDSCTIPNLSVLFDDGRSGGNDINYAAGCYQETHRYQCPTGQNVDDCGAIRADPECMEVGSECISFDEDGNCLNTTFEYRCGAAEAGAVTQTCGSQSWCIDGDCTEMDAPAPNNSFARAAAGMNLLQEIANDFTASGNDVTVFTGRVQSCSKWIFGLKNCCKISGTLLDVGLSACSEGEQELAIKRQSGQAHHQRNYCGSKAFFGSCTVRKSDFCTFNSRLARLIQEQGRAQLGIGWGDCRGFSVEELGQIDWSQVDLTEVAADIEAQMTIPDATLLKQELSRKIDDFYQRNRAGGDNAP